MFASSTFYFFNKKKNSLRQFRSSRWLNMIKLNLHKNWSESLRLFYELIARELLTSFHFSSNEIKIHQNLKTLPDHLIFKRNSHRKYIPSQLFRKIKIFQWRDFVACTTQVVRGRSRLSCIRDRLPLGILYFPFLLFPFFSFSHPSGNEAKDDSPRF